MGAALLANLTAMVFDYVARQKVGGIHLTYGLLEQLPVLAPDRLRLETPWIAGCSTVSWLLPRVLELTYSASDLGASSAGLRV